MAVFIAIPLAEVWLLLRVGDWLGLWPTIGLLIADAVLGAWLSKREGTRAWRALTAAFGSGRVPHGELADAALVLAGGLMLMFPGFFTDVVGLFCLVPFTRPLAKKLAAKVLADRVSGAVAGAPLGFGLPPQGAQRGRTPGFGRDFDGEVIDGEIIDEP